MNAKPADLVPRAVFQVRASGEMTLGDRKVRCALGHGGVRGAAAKREGDGGTPAGQWPLRRLLWRPDRLPAPATRLPRGAIGPNDGWCDDPLDSFYNRPVRLPHGASAESLWREDHLYDLVIILGYNDDPVVAGAGSAIFVHLARPDYAPTQGCVALARADMLTLLRLAGPEDLIEVALPE